MEIHLISDTHNQHSTLDIGTGADMIIHAGDACVKGNYTEAKEFLYWLVKQPYKYKIVVPGNHDPKLRGHPELVKLAEDMGIILLLNSGVEIEGIKIYGNTTTFKSHDKCKFPIDIRTKAWENIPSGLDILVTHLPPYGILDLADRGANCGCKELLKKVEEVKPAYHVFGHIHEQQRQTYITADTIFHNVSYLDRSYGIPSNKINILHMVK